MAEHEDEPREDEKGEGVYGGGHAGGYATERTTAPQSPYSTKDVVVGFVILAVGLLVTFAVPLLWTL